MRPRPRAGCGAGSRGFSGSEAGEQLVVGSGSQVPLDPGAGRVLHELPRVSPLVHDRVVPFAEQGGVVEVARAAIGPMNEVMRVRPLRGRTAPAQWADAHHLVRGPMAARAISTTPPCSANGTTRPCTGGDTRGSSCRTRRGTRVEWDLRASSYDELLARLAAENPRDPAPHPALGRDRIRACASYRAGRHAVERAAGRSARSPTQSDAAGARPRRDRRPCVHGETTTRRARARGTRPRHGAGDGAARHGCDTARDPDGYGAPDYNSPMLIIGIILLGMIAGAGAQMILQRGLARLATGLHHRHHRVSSVGCSSASSRATASS